MTERDDKSFIALFQAHPIPMWVYDLQTLAFVAVNTAAITHYGYSEVEFLHMTIKDIRPAEDLPKLHQTLEHARHAAIEKSGIWRHRKKDGTQINVEVTSHPISFNNRACRFVLAHDVTERLLAQSRVARLNRIYAVLSEINSAIVRIRDGQMFLDEACRIATVEGEFAAACISRIDSDGLNGSIVAKAGRTLASIDKLQISVRADGADADWLGNRALREKRPFICNDLRQDPWSASSGLQLAGDSPSAMAAFPLTIEGRCAGVLMLFTDTPDYFDEMECRLLDELAADVSFSLQYLEREEERKQVADRLRESEAGLRRAQIMNKIGHVITGPNGEFESWSETMPSLINLAPASMPSSTRQWLDFVHEADRNRFRNICIEAGRAGTRMDIEYRLRRGDGDLIQLRHVLEPLQGYVTPEGRMRWFNTIQDITEQKEQQDRIARLSRIYAVLSGINSAIVRTLKRDDLYQEVCRVAVRDGGFGLAWIAVIDPETEDGRIVAWFGGDSGYVERVRLTTREGVPENTRPASIAAREVRTVICNDILAESSLALHRAEMADRGYRAFAALPLIAGDRTAAVLGLYAQEKDFFDEDQLKLLNDLAGDLSFALRSLDQEERLSYLAYYDALTGLPNAKLFQDRVAQLLHVRHRSHGAVGVILLDLDRFSHLNDAFGRCAGDALLRQVAQRLEESLRNTDSVARVGGDTYAIALANLQRGEDAAAILQQQIFCAFSQPFVLDGQEIRMSAKAGLALHPVDGDDAETLFKHAEVALRNAKRSGDQYLYYAPQMNATRLAKLALENELQAALEQHEFVLHYQPRVDLQSGRIVSAEALIRWQHPRRGLLRPAEFIPLAEETGLIVPIGAWVFHTVCAQQAAWLARQIDIVPVAVNLSAVQCRKGQVLQTIRDAIDAHRVEAKYIEFELTETMVMDNPEEAAQFLHALKKMGARLSLDDFGTGYSSLAYLKRFPFDCVKIDRAFIAEVTRSQEDAAIAAAVIAMAHSLKLRVVAEGVETEGQLRFLRKLRCDEMQGFHFSPAVPGDAFESLLRDGARLQPVNEPAENKDTLLIVDDEPHNLSALNRLLRREGYRILTATGGQQGLELLAMNAVQVIISDQRMPGMSGSEFLGIVKELYPDTIRIMLSGYTDLTSVTDSVNRGAVFKFLTKPWDDELLREHVRDAFKRYRPT